MKGPSGNLLPFVDEMRQGNPVRSLWDRLSEMPGGRAIFSKLLGWWAPYTGTIHPEVSELRRGYARVEMADRRGVRNHLDSIHAIALVNLAEVASGLSVTYSLPDDLRGILVGFEIDYRKKARGRLTAEGDVVLPDFDGERRELEVPVVTRDEEGDVVTEATARWLVGPK
jgi:acyl-coenzyme A thioesterase PaaI-like protein